MSFQVALSSLRSSFHVSMGPTREEWDARRGVQSSGFRAVAGVTGATVGFNYSDNGGGSSGGGDGAKVSGGGGGSGAPPASPRTKSISFLYRWLEPDTMK